jgi:hypothetical protein
VSRLTDGTRSYSYRPRRLSRAVIDSLTRWALGSSAPAGISRREYERLIRAALNLPEFEPPVSRLLIGRDNSIWLRREHLGGGEVVWNVLDDVGNPVAIARTDADITLFQMDRDAAWGVETDDLAYPTS